MMAIKTLLWSFFVPGTITVLVPYLLLSSQFDFFRINISSIRFFGLIPILFGVLIYIWCAWDFTFIGKGTPAPFDPPKELVIKGPYQYVRNPMYVFVVLVLIGEAIFFETTILVLFAVVAMIFFHLWVVLYEEPTLKRKFGWAYERYCENVKRWLPSRPDRSETRTA
jgi:protein-S-isoprenylcysteine O-methyltransferase Ste14